MSQDGGRRVKGLEQSDASAIAHFMVCYTKNNLMVASNKKIFYIDVEQVLEQHDRDEFYGKEVGIEVPDESIRSFDVATSFKFKGFLDIGNGNVAMIMED